MNSARHTAASVPSVSGASDPSLLGFSPPCALPHVAVSAFCVQGSTGKMLFRVLSMGEVGVKAGQKAHSTPHQPPKRVAYYPRRHLRSKASRIGALAVASQSA